jgi:hypothetical protein
VPPRQCRKTGTDCGGVVLCAHHLGLPSVQYMPRKGGTIRTWRWLRAAQFCRIVEVLDGQLEPFKPTPFDRDFAGFMRKHLDIGDPEAFILAQAYAEKSA